MVDDCNNHELFAWHPRPWWRPRPPYSLYLCLKLACSCSLQSCAFSWIQHPSARLHSPTYTTKQVVGLSQTAQLWAEDCTNSARFITNFKLHIPRYFFVKISNARHKPITFWGDKVVAEFVFFRQADFWTLRYVFWIPKIMTTFQSFIKIISWKYFSLIVHDLRKCSLQGTSPFKRLIWEEFLPHVLHSISN